MSDALIASETKPHAIIVDIDGTVARKGDRDIYDYSKVLLDTPIMPIVRLVQEIGENREVIFVSGREGVCYSVTSLWLQKNLGFASADAFELYMRPVGDFREDSVVKKEIYRTFIEDDFVIDYVIDDRNSVVKMWRDLGLTVLQVADGDF